MLLNFKAVKSDIKIIILPLLTRCYRVFHGFGQVKFADSGSILGSSQFSLLPHLPQKTMVSLKVVKIDSKIIILLCQSKSVIRSVPISWEFSIKVFWQMETTMSNCTMYGRILRTRRSNKKINIEATFGKVSFRYQSWPGANTIE